MTARASCTNLDAARMHYLVFRVSVVYLVTFRRDRLAFIDIRDATFPSSPALSWCVIVSTPEARRL